MLVEPFGLPAGNYGSILADPPWRFETYSRGRVGGVWNTDPEPIFTQCRAPDYQTMTDEDIYSLPVGELAAKDSVLFLWCVWPHLKCALKTIDTWGFEYKTCAFAWVKARANQIEMFRDDITDLMGLGYWTRANSEVCLLATRGKPKRIHADVRQAIIEPRREHSRKPACVHERIERLVAGPYVELFARARRPGWDCWGNEVEKFREAAE